MASASCSTSIPPQPPSSYSHHVFLSFRGEDTRNGFTSHLYAALNRKGITTYNDDKKLRKGDVISDELLKAIEESMFAVIVFSSDYASSSWCLDELCKIIDCKNKLGLQMVVGFYDMEPCDVRHQIGTFREAFKKHEERYDTMKVQRWKEALKHVAEYSGWSSKNQYMGIGRHSKTTIARAVFETIRSRFEASCFVADVRQYFEKQDITDLQNQLLKQMNIISSDAYYNKYDGSKIIQTSFRRKKVLIVFDDVSHENQLENLAKEKDWFGAGSRIIITTRNKEVLKQQEGHETYEVKVLVERECFELFCSEAFNQAEPLERFLDLSKEVVNYCSGLPLALKATWMQDVIASCPYIEMRHSFTLAVAGLTQPHMIPKTSLRRGHVWGTPPPLSGLGTGYTTPGGEKNGVTKILKECGYDAEIGIDILINRSLLTLELDWKRDTLIGMHDLVEEMGKQIVIQESADGASKRSRLWCYEDIDSVLAQRQDIEATQSMALRMDQKYTGENWRDSDIRGSCFSKLQLLILDGVTARILCNIPSTLKVLRWKKCPMETLPLITDQRYELVEIDLRESQIVQLWEGKKFLNKLEHLNLSSCHKLKETPDLSGAPNLKTLTIRYCVELNYIHPSLTHHKSLVKLNLGECYRLETAGDKLEMSSLKKLTLLECSSFWELPEFGECMKQLLILTLTLGIGKPPSTFGNLVGLTELELYVKYIGSPISLGCLLSLKKLSLNFLFDLYDYRSEIQNIDVLLRSVSLLTALSSLKLFQCFLESEESTPYYDLGQLPFLTKLDLSWNLFKKVLPDLPSSLRLLQAIGCYSLDASNVNDVISKACCVFAESASQDGEDVFEMVIPGTGREIPAWFEHQEQGNGVSLSCPSTKTMALSLCFAFDNPFYGTKSFVICCNGKEFINKSLLKVFPCMHSGFMAIVFLNGYYVSNLLGQHDLFHILFPNYADKNNVGRSAARWVCNQDIQVPNFKKRKATLQLSKQDIMPLHEEEEGCASHQSSDNN
ncbi:hypothetical protein PIB30_045544 [Stylosanthes scabra]|uniref:TIR domain-containing protein n=1 Tax=Stylosanthes scabra TaxID=79078 RepID=A0ABU6UJF6_9FABA|nr:hypothetical protein [Stylosanthes scabra]